MTVKQNKKEIRTLITNKKKAMSVEEITAGSRIITDRLELSKDNCIRSDGQAIFGES